MSSHGIELPLKTISDWLGIPAADERTVYGISSDSRSLEKGNLFVALRGPNHDGHSHLSSSAAKGACAAIVESVDPQVALPQLQVANCHQAMAVIALPSGPGSL